jgi:hypothetical protein
MSQQYPQYTHDPNQQVPPGHGAGPARLESTNGDLDSIIANGNGGNQVITIKKTDQAFETRYCGAWTRIN